MADVRDGAADTAEADLRPWQPGTTGRGAQANVTASLVSRGAGGAGRECRRGAAGAGPVQLRGRGRAVRLHLGQSDRPPAGRAGDGVPGDDALPARLPRDAVVA